MTPVIQGMMNLKYNRFLYDFAVLGGAVGSIPFVGMILPEGSVILSVIARKVTPWASETSSAIVQLSVPVDGYICYGNYISDGSWIVPSNVTDRVMMIPTADRTIQLDISGEALTAGSYWFDVVYYIPAII